MEEVLMATARYWCYTCSRVISPIMEVEIKCPYCGDGFVEEIGSFYNHQDADDDFESDRDRTLSLWAPVLLGMMGNRRRRRHTIRRLGFDSNDENDDEDIESRHARETDLDREMEFIIRRRRRRSSATMLQLLQGIRDRAGISSELENLDRGRDREEDRDGERERERVILINPSSQTIVQGSSNESSQTSNLIGSLGDYFVGPGLDLLLQNLSENDPSRYGTPPAQKEAIEAMPTVKVEENVQCSVCLDDFEVGTKARMMPCKHKFHEGCILPWLELQSSCPVCRYQLPAEKSKNDFIGSREGNNGGEQVRESSRGDGDDEPVENRRNESGRRFQFPWPFSSLFSSSSGSQPNAAGNSTNSSSLLPSSSNDS